MDNIQLRLTGERQVCSLEERGNVAALNTIRDGGPKVVLEGSQSQMQLTVLEEIIHLLVTSF